MKNMTLYTSLTAEECRNIFEQEVKQYEYKFLTIKRSKYIGDFRDKEFWIATTIYPFFLRGSSYRIFDGSYKMLQGTIIEDRKDKNTITCEFGISRSFIASVSIFTLFFLLILISAMWDGSMDIFPFVSGFFVSVILIFCIVVYFITYNQYNAMFNFVKEVFRCEDSM